MEFFAQASPGTERALHDELCELNFAGARLNRGGIPFRGDWGEGWRACLQSRIAQRIQLLLGTFEAASPGELYEAARSIAWEEFISARQTLAVGIYCRSRFFTHSGATALKVKDAVVDRVRDRTGTRPDIDRDDPDVRVFVYIAESKVKLYLDLSGEPLHKRGYRTEAGPAPLRENLAAALLRMAGWDRETALADPMCGSGTIAVEAALWASRTAPGLFRERFGFERWAGFGEAERREMDGLREDAWAERTRQTPMIFASDRDEEVLQGAQVNARKAGVRLKFRRMQIQDLQLSSKVRTVVSNPPYDERLEASEQSFREIGAALSRMHGVKVCLLSGSPELDKYIPAAAEESLPVKNGNIDCRFCVYRIP